jgi:hypothetical protein
MGKGSPFLLPLCFVLLLVLSTPTSAQWVENGKAVCTASYAQQSPRIVPDESGGSIVVWLDTRTASLTEVYAQSIDQYGQDQWAADGVLVYTGATSASHIAAATDGSGGAIVAIVTGNDSLYVQRITTDGIPWSPSQGTGICGSVWRFIEPVVSICSDGAGGAIVFWTDDRSGAETNLYAQLVNAAGATQWTANGVLVCGATWLQYIPNCCSDMNGGAIVTWEDERSDNGDVYAQRIDAGGSALWTADGVPVCNETGDQEKPFIASDGAGGALFVWEDGRATGRDIYLQKLDSLGVAQWTAGGVAATSAVYDQMEARVVSDGAGGAIVSWLDVRLTLVNVDIYAQRVDSSGAVVWDTDGTPICTAASNQSYPRIAEDGAGGAVIAWNDSRDVRDDIYAQRIDPDGNVLWAEDGDSVCVGEIDSRYNKEIAYVGKRGIVIAWWDARNGAAYSDIFAQGLGVQGYWGYPEPLIHSVEDVPGDQGGVINLFWYASLWEGPPYDEITHYTLWRAVEPQEAAAAIQKGARLIEHPAALDVAGGGRVFRRAETGAATYFWEYIDTQQSYNFEAYAKAIPTLFDSTGVHHAYHYVQILGHTSSPNVYYTSGVDSAYSVDNLSPAAPSALAGEQSQTPAGLQLTWDPNTEADLAGYNVYRGTSSDFVPGSGNLVSWTSNTEVFDGDWSWDVDYWYKVAALDVHGNESPFAALGPDLVTGSDPPAVPYVTFLEQNFPNPFNPATTIPFGLRERTHVSLEVYDAAGRLVATLIDEIQPAGPHTTGWNGNGTDGRPAASGVYFYKLLAGGFEETKKMILLR